ncbi:hypothetical protein TrCOL_g5544 [Triparma columacea]|uniref:Uncharacterized protein n=1 Tax=Triparma columacea TaxID=722753 RepID=A0A9W7GRE9_9STRA|nr:hypothetical protein TrCOL_g5544 [Triparma columacea]
MKIIRVLFSLALLVVGTDGRGLKKPGKNGKSTPIIDSDKIPGFYLSCTLTIAMSDYVSKDYECDYGFEVTMSDTAYNSLPDKCKPTAIKEEHTVLGIGSSDIKTFIVREIQDSSPDPTSEESLIDGLGGTEAGYYSVLYKIYADEEGDFPSVITQDDWKLEGVQMFLETYQETSKFPLALHFEQTYDASKDLSSTDRGCQGEWNFAANERYDVGAFGVVESLIGGTVVALANMELVKVDGLPTSVEQAQMWCDDRRAKLGGIFD